MDVQEKRLLRVLTAIGSRTLGGWEYFRDIPFSLAYYQAERVRAPYVITLDPADWQSLEASARRGRAEHRQVLRARIVLSAADGRCNTDTGRALGVVVDTVRKRFCREELSSVVRCRRSTSDRGVRGT